MIVYQASQKAIKEGRFGVADRIVFVGGGKALVINGDRLTTVLEYPEADRDVDVTTEPLPVTVYANDEMMLYIIINKIPLPFNVRSEHFPL
jgi:hypothetical protein